MKLIDVVRKAAASLLVWGVASFNYAVFAQEDKYKDYREVYRDTTDYVAPTELGIKKDTIVDPLRVVTNKFGKNWFIFATGGLHTYRGDYSTMGKFSGTLSPDWSIGIGKWFTPGIGLKVEFIRSNSRGYTGYTTGHYGYGDVLYKEDGTPYWKMKTSLRRLM